MNTKPTPPRDQHKRDFFAPSPTVEELAAEQGVESVKDVTSLLGDFWPDDESNEEVLRTLRAWRQETEPDS